MPVSQVVMAPSPVRRTGTFDILRYPNDQVSFGSPTPPATAKFAVDASAGAFDVAGSFDGGSVALGPLAADPPVILTQGQVYTKNVLGVAQLFYEASDGTINQLTPGSALVVTLQDAYDDGNTIAATAARPIAFSNAVDATDLLTLTRTFAGAGVALAVSMGAATTGNGIEVTMTAGSTGLAALFSGASISCPGAGASSERFGNGALAGGADGVAVGFGASASGADSVAVGFGADASRGDSVVVGSGASATTAGLGIVVIGKDASSASGKNVVIGASSSIVAGAGGSVAVGFSSSVAGGAGTSVVVGDAATTSVSNSIAVGYSASIALGATVRSVVIGESAAFSATGGGVIVGGTSTTTTFAGATIVGLDATVGADNATAIGFTADAGGSPSVAVGAISSAGGDNSVAVGYNAQADFLNSIAISGTIGANNAICIGAASANNGNSSVLVGYSSSISDSDTVVIGASNSSTFDQVVILGFNQTATATGQFIVSTIAGITDTYLGNGVSFATPVNHTIHATGGLGAAVAGAQIRVAAGISGDAATQSGDVRLGVSLAGSGTTTTDVVYVTGGGTVGRVGIGAAPGAFELDVTGSARVTGKLTVGGVIDPTAVILSGSTDLYFESSNGNTAAVSGAATGRIRYNNATGFWQISTQTSAYSNISTAATSTLQNAYTNGGAGGGAIALTLTGGPLAITNPAATAQTAVTVTQNTAGQAALSVSGGNISLQGDQNIVPSADNNWNVGIIGTRVKGVATYGFAPIVVTKSAAYTLTASDFTIRADATGGAFTVTLPAVASHRGRIYTMKRINAGANKPVLAAAAGETIDGAASKTLNAQYDSLMVQAPDTGTDWMII